MYRSWNIAIKRWYCNNKRIQSFIHTFKVKVLRNIIYQWTQKLYLCKNYSWKVNVGMKVIENWNIVHIRYLEIYKENMEEAVVLTYILKVFSAIVHVFLKFWSHFLHLLVSSLFYFFDQAMLLITILLNIFDFLF